METRWPNGRKCNRCSNPAAVLAGLTLPYSNGVVEGKVNKLKLIKRTMFGRAGFPLLRKPVLHALSSSSGTMKEAMLLGSERSLAE
jgi:hypothetical protein